MDKIQVNLSSQNDLPPCIIMLETCHCGGTLKPFVTGPYDIIWNEKPLVLQTTLYLCKICGMSIRGVDNNNPLVETHYDLVNYTIPEREDHWREKRRKFFNWFYRLAIKHLEVSPKRVLDFGCSYGHLLDLFAERGAETAGIEVCQRLYVKLKRKGCHQVYLSLEDSNLDDNSFDLVIAIDSIYCCGPDPAERLALMARKLRSGGILITRTTNRNQIHRIYAFLWHLQHGGFANPAPLSNTICGDAIYNFSEKSLVSSFDYAGLKKLAAYRWEIKRRTRREYIRDTLVLLLHYASLGQLDLCPGLVMVARKI